MNFNSILIGSTDPARLADYYTALFGKPAFEDSGYSGWQLGSGSVVVGPHDGVTGDNSQPGRLIWNIETPEVKSEFDRLVAAGAQIVQEPYSPSPDEADGTMLIATFADPDGNYFQLMSPMPEAAGK